MDWEVIILPFFALFKHLLKLESETLGWLKIKTVGYGSKAVPHLIKSSWVLTYLLYTSGHRCSKFLHSGQCNLRQKLAQQSSYDRAYPRPQTSLFTSLSSINTILLQFGCSRWWDVLKVFREQWRPLHLHRFNEHQAGLGWKGGHGCVHPRHAWLWHPHEGRAPSSWRRE